MKLIKYRIGDYRNLLPQSKRQIYSSRQEMLSSSNSCYDNLTVIQDGYLKGRILFFDGSILFSFYHGAKIQISKKSILKYIELLEYRADKLYPGEMFYAEVKINIAS